MYHEKRYLQFNNLVFDGYDMLSSYDETTAFKFDTQAYSYGHGSYAPLKADYMFATEKSVSLTLTLHTNKIPCEDREFYVRFAEQELTRPGKLWAVKNNEIIWAYAYPKNIHPIVGNRFARAEYDIEFVLPEGIWHKADKQKTFVLPYNVCTFMDCKGYRTIDPCADSIGGDCCEVALRNRFEEEYADRCFCCCVDEITADMALCYHMKDLQKFYTCETPYQLVYDCERAKRYSTNDFLGQRLCVDELCGNGRIVGKIYSETDIPTTELMLTLDAKSHNPWITINGNTNIIEGDYDGVLRIESSGDVYYKPDGGCEELLDPSVWVIPNGMDYGWTIYPQNNSISINLNECCTGLACVYVSYDNITI